MPTIRKAIVAGLAAALSTVITSLVAEIPKTNAGWGLLASGAVSAFIAAAYLVYQTRNAPATTATPTVRSGRPAY